MIILYLLTFEKLANDTWPEFFMLQINHIILINTIGVILLMDITRKQMTFATDDGDHTSLFTSSIDN